MVSFTPAPTGIQKIHPTHLRSENDGVWSASIPLPPEGFQSIRIAPLLEGKNQAVWATFQIQVPPNKLILDNYRWPIILVLLVILIAIIRKMLA